MFIHFFLKEKLCRFFQRLIRELIRIQNIERWLKKSSQLWINNCNVYVFLRNGCSMGWLCCGNIFDKSLSFRCISFKSKFSIILFYITVFSIHFLNVFAVIVSLNISSVLSSHLPGPGWQAWSHSQDTYLIFIFLANVPQKWMKDKARLKPTSIFWQWKLEAWKFLHIYNVVELSIQ